MSALPPALWSSVWRGPVVSVYASGIGSPLSQEAAMELLSEEERKRALRFLFSEDRGRWTRSRAILRCCIAERLGCHPGDLEFEAGEFGKPFLKGGAAGQESLHFNTSHSGDYVAVCLSPDACGVDLECWKEEYPGEVAAFAFREDEQAGLASALSPVQHFLSLWTGKEAVMKCSGQGLTIPLSAVWIDEPVSSAHGIAGIAGVEQRFELLRYCVPGSWMLTAAWRLGEQAQEPAWLAAQGRAV